MKEIPLPIIGQQYHFFDDGKISYSRHSMATVLDIITPTQAKLVLINKYHWDENDSSIQKLIPLYDIWREEIDAHRQGINFTVHNGSSTKPGAPWLYAEDTDYFIKCSIPEYDDEDIWFVRMTNGGWFSMNTVKSWMTGELDVTGELYESLEETYKDL